jgi:acyl carrier protein
MSEDANIVDTTLRAVLSDVLGVDAGRVASFDDNSGLFGTLPELDSMAVATLLTELEDRLGITIDDDEVEIAIFETFGALRSFLIGKALR